MSLTEGLLFIIVLVLLYLVAVRDKRNAQWWDRAKDAQVVIKTQPAAGQAPAAPVVTLSGEQKILQENMEFFTQCADPSGVADNLASTCVGPMIYATDDYGSPGMDFKDWVTSQAVDNQVISNHQEFVKDQFNTLGQNLTGRTFSPDSNDSYDPQPWIGIRGRPQAVQVCNPTQISDMDYDLFERTPKMTWRTSP